MRDQTTWTVTVVFTESDAKTRADAILMGAPDELRGWGQARRNPVDPDRPAIGEQVAAARALNDLAHHLLEQAAQRIEEWEGHDVTLHG